MSKTNYALPDDYEEKPKDWLVSALIFTRALSFILKENEGIVVNIMNDMNNSDWTREVKQVFVYKKSNQVHITECEDNLPEGQLIWMHEFEDGSLQ